MESSQRLSLELASPTQPAVQDRQFFIIGTLDRAIAVLGVIFSTETVEVISDGFGLPSILLTGIRYLIPGLILIRLASRLKSTIRALQSDLFLLILNIIVFASFIWSIDPDLTITGLRGQYIQAVLIALFLATRFSLAQQIRLITVSMGITVAISLLFVGLAPELAIARGAHAGAWQGIYGHKNYFSTALVTTITACLVQILSPSERRPWYLPLAALSTFLLLMSTSKTGIVLLAAIMAVLTLYPRFRWRGMKSVLMLYLIIVTTAAGLVILFSAWEPILTSIGGDVTLTGRTPIWEILREEFIPQKLFLGYGVNAFWKSSEVSMLMESINGHAPAHGHNGWYDMLIDVGIVGFFFYLISAVRVWTRAFKLAYISRSMLNMWPLAFLTVFLVNNFTESLMLTRINFIWVIYMSLCWSLKEAIIETRLHNDGMTDFPEPQQVNSVHQRQ